MARRLSKADRKGLFIFAGVAFALIGLFVAKFTLESGRERLDKITLCPRNSTYAHTVILIDKTDPFSDGQQRAIKQVIREIQHELMIGEKLSIFVLDNQNYSTPESSFALCNPGTGEEANELTQNPRKIQRIYEERFGAPLDDVVSELAKGEEAKNSPIMEMVQSVSYIPDFSFEYKPRKLFIFSDMLQNTQSYSQYRDRSLNGAPDYEKFRGSRYSSSVSTNLDQVDVRIFYLIRSRTADLQTRGHILFWEKYFEQSGAQITEVRPIR